MIIVPVAGDVLKTVDGLPFKVVSYTNYNADGPAVLCTSESASEAVPIQFETIAVLNNAKVKLLTNAEGYKVFGTDAYVKRQHQLPQPGEFIDSNVSGVESRPYQVVRLRVHVQNMFAKGMLIDVIEKDTNDKISITLNQITNIEQSLFKRKAFLAYYADYTPKGAV